MATLRSILETASGLYRESRTGEGYERQDLLDRLNDETLNSPVVIRKVSTGVYHIALESGASGTYDLYSRRRELRAIPLESAEDI